MHVHQRNQPLNEQRKRSLQSEMLFLETALRGSASAEVNHFFVMDKLKKYVEA